MAVNGVDDRRPHLALITCNPVETGGMQTFSRRLLDHVLQCGWRVTVALSGRDIYTPETGGEDESPVIDRVDWLDAQLAGDREYRCRIVVNRFRWFRRTRPDVAIFIQSSNTPYRASVLGAWLAGVPVVTTHRTLAWPLCDSGSRQHFFGLLEGLKLYQTRARLRTQLTARLARFIVYNSHAVRAGYEDLYRYPKRKGAVIANALDPTTGNGPLPKSRLPSEREPRVVGYVGRLGGEKRVDVLIRAMAELDSSQSVVAHIYGDGPKREELQRLAAALGIDHRVRFLGEVHDVAAALAEMDVFVMPSDRESSSNAVLEAQAAGLPVIVTDVGGLPELVDYGQCGIVVPAGDACAMAAAIDHLLKSPQIAHQVGQEGRRRAITHHDSALIGQKWLSVLKAAIEGKHHQPSLETTISALNDNDRSWPGILAEGRA